MGQRSLKVGVDVLTIQSPGPGRDDVGRHVRGVVEALFARAEDDGVTYVLYSHEDLPVPGFAESERALGVMLRHQPCFCPAATIEGLLEQNADGLDAFLVLDPFDPRPGHGPPPRFPDGPSTFAYVQDASPFVFQERELPDAEVGERLYRHLERLRSYDCLVAANEATSSDLQRLLGLPASRILAAISRGNCPESAARFLVEALMHPPARVSPRRTIRRRRAARRLALFSPFPPKGTGVADHVDKLAQRFGLITQWTSFTKRATCPRPRWRHPTLAVLTSGSIPG